MNYLTKVISSAVENGFRMIKVLRFGKNDVQTADVAAPFGVDTNPPPEMIAVFSESTVKGQPVIIGYINKSLLADAGEHRTYSTDSTGQTVKFYIWQHNDGTCEIGGNVDNMVRYSKLEAAFNQLKNDFNAFVTKFNAHTHPYVNGSSPSVTGSTATPGSSSSADITPAKINEIKTL